MTGPYLQEASQARGSWRGLVASEPDQWSLGWWTPAVNLSISTHVRSPGTSSASACFFLLLLSLYMNHFHMPCVRKGKGYFHTFIYLCIRYVYVVVQGICPFMYSFLSVSTHPHIYSCISFPVYPLLYPFIYICICYYFLTKDHIPRRLLQCQGSEKSVSGKSKLCQITSFLSVSLFIHVILANSV